MENKVKINYNGAKKNIVIMVTIVDKKNHGFSMKSMYMRTKPRFRRDGRIDNAVKKWT